MARKQISPAQKKIDADKKRLKRLFAGNDSNTQELIEPLLQNAAFMQAALTQLQKEILDAGMIDEYQNGQNQKGFKISANLQAYNQLVRNYNAVICKLSKYVTAEDETLDKFFPFQEGHFT